MDKKPNETQAVSGVLSVLLITIAFLGLLVPGFDLLIAFVLAVIAILSLPHRKFFQTQALIALALSLISTAALVFNLHPFGAPNKIHAYWSCPTANKTRHLVKIPHPPNLPFHSTLSLHPPAPNCNLIWRRERAAIL